MFFKLNVFLFIYLLIVVEFKFDFVDRIYVSWKNIVLYFCFDL